MKHIDIFSLPEGYSEDLFKKAVAHPDHYVVKYISRAGKKHDRPIEDIEKAKWYIDRWLEMEKANVI